MERALQINQHGQDVAHGNEAVGASQIGPDALYLEKSWQLSDDASRRVSHSIAESKNGLPSMS